MSEARAGGGLDGVIAADTVLSHADGERGILLVRGRTLAELVERHGYEGAVALMWDGFAGQGLTRASVTAALGAARQRAFARLGDWLAVATRHPLGEAVRIALAALPDDSAPADIAGAVPVAVAALLRTRGSGVPVAPDPTLGTAADLLRMMAGAPAEPRSAAALDAYVTTVIDNGLSASTFTARIVASTRASLASAVVGAYCAFTGPLHGGAPGPTLDLLDAAAAAPDIDAWLDAKLQAGERLMGFGHRMFRVRDPRADVLRAALDKLGPDAGRLRFAADFERRALAALARFKPGRSLQSNVELNAALLLEAVGVPRDAFTPVFALARVAAWIAHALEQQQTGRMIRPTARYVGPLTAGLDRSA
jgi:citrate synthase